MRVYRLLELIFYLFFIVLCSVVGYFAGNYVGSILGGCIVTAITALFFILYLNSKEQEAIEDIMDRCIIMNHPNLAPGWGCCQCQTYNGIHRNSCKNCDHEPCYSNGENTDDQATN